MRQSKGLFPPIKLKDESSPKKSDTEIYSEESDIDDIDHIKSLEYGFESKEDMCKVIYHSNKELKIGDPNDKIVGNRFDGSENDIYVGSINNRQQRHGNGVLFYSNGDIYKGDWINDQKSGHGEYLFFNGNKIDGNFEENLMNGISVVTFNNGVELCANFKNNQIASEAIEINFDNLNQPLFKFEGKEPFKDEDGNWVVEGAVLFKNDDVFTGKLINGKIQGQGRIDYLNGDCNCFILIIQRV